MSSKYSLNDSGQHTICISMLQGLQAHQTCVRCHVPVPDAHVFFFWYRLVCHTIYRARRVAMLTFILCLCHCMCPFLSLFPNLKPSTSWSLFGSLMCSHLIGLPYLSWRIPFDARVFLIYDRCPEKHSHDGWSSKGGEMKGWGQELSSWHPMSWTLTHVMMDHHKWLPLSILQCLRAYKGIDVLGLRVLYQTCQLWGNRPPEIFILPSVGQTWKRGPL